jgi:hypothetical protein
MSGEWVRCSHEKCECMVEATIEPEIGDPSEAYCSDYCREAYATEEEMETCACGHPACDAL